MPTQWCGKTAATENTTTLYETKTLTTVRKTITGILLALWPLWAMGQNYSTTDTVTEYPNKGTFYHDMFEGRKTSNGEIFDQNKFTAAHWKIKLGTMVMVTNRNTGLQVIVKVNDRCPKRGVLDMSHRAATAIGIRGCQPVTVRILPDGYEERWAAQETMFDSVHSRLTTKQPETKPTAPTPTVAKEEKSTEKEKASQPATDCYNLMLETEISHAEAFESIQKLPELYRNKVLVEPAEDSGMVMMTLDVRLPKENAENLRRALRHSFNNVVLAPCD